MAKLNFNFQRENITGIKVIGVGGGGGNAVARMYELGIKDVSYIVCNTDAQALQKNPVPTKIQLGPSICQGLGAGADWQKGEEAARESLDEIREELQENIDMVIITAGMGGGTGTGAAPVIAELAKEMGILTVAIVTKPFKMEGKKRMEKAKIGIENLKKHVDSLLVIDNQKLFEETQEKNISMRQAYFLLDEALFKAAKGIAEIITREGMMNLDFADVRKILTGSGTLFVGIGKAEGEDRATKAALRALEAPMLEISSVKGATGVLFNVISADVSPMEMQTIVEIINEAVGSDDVEVIMGHCINEEMTDEIEIIFIAAGFPDITTYTTPSLQSQKIQQKISAPRSEEIPVQPKIQQIPFEEVEKEAEFVKSIKKVALSPTERLKRMKKQGNHDLSSTHTKKQIQKIPAYLRKNINVHAVEDSVSEGYSNVSMERDAYGNISFRENSYFADNAD